MSTIIKTVADLEASGRYAFPGGYPVVYYPVDEHGQSDDTQVCFDCAKRDLKDASAYSDGQNAGFDRYVEQGDQQYYGGLTCDQCSQYIVEPACPECGDELFDGSRLLHADNVDASLLHLHCAAQLLAGRGECGSAERIPGVGIKVSTAGGVHSPWYAPAGTIYRYR